MFERTFDAEWANELVNHPSIRPFVGDVSYGEIDLTEVIGRQENLFLKGEFGGFGLTWSCPRVFEVHTFILPEGRGRWAYAAAKEMIVMAKDTGAEKLWTMVATDQPNVKRFAKMSGMVYTGIQIPKWGKAFDVLEMVI
jgi:hypothetical protein